MHNGVSQDPAQLMNQMLKLRWDAPAEKEGAEDETEWGTGSVSPSEAEQQSMAIEDNGPEEPTKVSNVDPLIQSSEVLSISYSPMEKVCKSKLSSLQEFH